MAATKPKVMAPTDEELSQMLEGLEEDMASVYSTKGNKSKETNVPKRQAEKDLLAEQDILAELENLGADLPQSRPHTPHVISSTKPTKSPATILSQINENKPSVLRTSGESNRSISVSSNKFHEKNENSESEKKLTENRNSEPTTSGGWWGSVFATATAAVKNAEAAMKEIQQNEEAKRWADQVKGNVGALRGIGEHISSRALPTFTHILHTIAPPISSHERLQVHITHDFVNYPSLDPLIYSTFSRVMAQVEGGDLLVIQRGHESTVRNSSEIDYVGVKNSWSDNPWWRQNHKKRSIGEVNGLVEGTKLVRVSAETYANEYFNSHGGLDLAVQRATENISESNPVRSSDIFLAVQAIIYNAPEDLFQASAQEGEESIVPTDKDCPDELILFAIYLYDPVHSITFHTLSQSMPIQWIRWLDASPVNPGISVASTSKSISSFFTRDGDETECDLPQEIVDIKQNGGVDPREWVSEWVEEILSLATGVVAQKYVAQRMRISDATVGKARAKNEQILRDVGEII